MTDHPTQFELECFCGGERVEFLGRSVAAHVERCAECGSFIHALSLEKTRFFATHLAPAAFVQHVQDMAPSARPTFWNWQPMFRWSASLALAGAVLALGRSDIETNSESAAAPAESRRFVTKGGVSFAVIRKRQVDQQMQSGRVSIVPGDELRLRFSLPARAHVAAGILVDDGTWVPFFDGEFEAGTHTPNATLKVDSNPSSGTVLFGSPVDVEQARLHRDFARVELAELVWTAPL